MSDFGGSKEHVRQQILDLKCSISQNVPVHLGTRKNRYVCSNGHIVCELCKVRECICKSKSYCEKPVKYIEDWMEKLSWHCCPHFKNGCHDVFDKKGLENHQKCCIYREIHCVFHDCKIQVSFKDFFEHVETCHQDRDLNNATKIDEKTFIVSCYIYCELYASKMDGKTFIVRCCGYENCRVVTKLETSDGVFLLVRQKRHDKLIFWVYFIGSPREALNYYYKLNIANKAGKEKYDFEGKVLTLDKDCLTHIPYLTLHGEVSNFGHRTIGSVFIMETEAAKNICDEDSKFDVKITVKYLN